jgi:hypothetical protein
MPLFNPLWQPPLPKQTKRTTVCTAESYGNTPNNESYLASANRLLSRRNFLNMFRQSFV